MSDRTDPSVMVIFAAVSLMWLLPVLIGVVRALRRRRRAREDVTWSPATGTAAATYLMIGDDVYEEADGGWRKIAGDGWHVRIGPDGGALVTGPAPEEES